ncbi:MAG: DUF2851 family protein [Cyclobacteriaceae bacterium]|jgi:hypothetical protein
MFIDESFVSFLWQHSYYNTALLTSTAGEKIVIKHPGYINIHAGPDFMEAKVRIGDIDWAGSIEIHVKASHWYAHDHSSNLDYDKVILHVVWENDLEVYRNDNTPIPTLELFDKVDKGVLERFMNLIYQRAGYPCHPYLSKVRNISVLSMIDKAMAERLDEKADDILKIFLDTGKDWEETSYRILFRNFGFKVNQDNMSLLSKLIPFRILSRHRKNRLQIEALLFGTAGFLDKVCDTYSQNLRDEYLFLRYKYSLRSRFLKRYQWRFLRLRPQNFPTIRIAQIAKLLGNMDKIFSFIIGSPSVKEIMNRFNIKQGVYWQHHYDFGKRSKQKLSGIGRDSVYNILINSFVPILTAYGRNIKDHNYLAKAHKFLEVIPPENNHIIRKWVKIGIHPVSSFESQGLIELSNSYCNKKKCLNCNIGTDILLNNH